jgi:hypothetical protein
MHKIKVTNKNKYKRTAAKEGQGQGRFDVLVAIDGRRDGRDDLQE